MYLYEERHLKNLKLLSFFISGKYEIQKKLNKSLYTEQRYNACQ